jgi:DNA-binding NarL/FixJ family response regulator
MINAILADSQKIVCEGIRLILEQDGGIRVFGCATTVEDAEELYKRHEPDVVLMDAAMKAEDGTDGTSRIRSLDQGAKVILLSGFSDEERVIAALCAGAIGYVLKDINSEELILTVKSAARGLNVLHKEAFLRFTGRVGSFAPVPAQQRRDAEQKLTKREIEIIRLVTEGKENREIARCLFISEGTVKNTISGILKKLNLKTRIQLVVFAVKNEIGA